MQYHIEVALSLGQLQVAVQGFLNADCGWELCGGPGSWGIDRVSFYQALVRKTSETGAEQTPNTARAEICAIADELDMLPVSTGDAIHKRFELQQRLRKLSPVA